MLNETHRAPPRYKISDFFSSLLGANKTPAEFRQSQNWIGGSRPGNAAFVPPPPERMMECLNLFEHFIHDENTNCLFSSRPD
jgi:Fic family protein